MPFPPEKTTWTRKLPVEKWEFLTAVLGANGHVQVGTLRVQVPSNNQQQFWRLPKMGGPNLVVALLGPPEVQFYPFSGEGSPTKINQNEKVGTLILTSILEDLDCNPKLREPTKPTLRRHAEKALLFTGHVHSRQVERLCSAKPCMVVSVRDLHHTMQGIFLVPGVSMTRNKNRSITRKHFGQ